MILCQRQRVLRRQNTSYDQVSTWLERSTLATFRPPIPSYWFRSSLKQLRSSTFPDASCVLLEFSCCFASGGFEFGCHEVNNYCQSCDPLETKRRFEQATIIAGDRKRRCQYCCLAFVAVRFKDLAPFLTCNSCAVVKNCEGETANRTLQLLLAISRSA